jgi:transcription initiation factor TFIIIB Brf1 subunit/transcription initiation factor TFIIB
MDIDRDDRDDRDDGNFSDADIAEGLSDPFQSFQSFQSPLSDLEFNSFSEETTFEEERVESPEPTQELTDSDLHSILRPAEHKKKIKLRNIVMLPAEQIKETKEVILSDLINCPKCKIRCRITDSTLLCEKCGEERSNFNQMFSSSMTYNTNSSSFMPFTFTGHASGKYTKSLLKSNSNASMFSRPMALKELNLRNDLSTKFKVPKNAISLAAEFYCEIKIAISKMNRRDFTGKSGLLAGALWWACDSLGIRMAQKDIADLMDTDTKMLFNAIEIINDLIDKKMVRLFKERMDPVKSFMNRFMGILKIPAKYRDFMEDIIKVADAAKLSFASDCQVNTKCAGAIMLLCVRVKELNHITKDLIQTSCRVSKATFIKYYKMLYSNHALLKRVFKTHKIPMDSEWKTDK